MSTRWQCKRDTAANWTSNNPVLLSGEWGVETDTKKLKMGDGATAWNGLAYDFSPQNNVAITGGSITGITDLAVADGGTGASTLTDHGILLGSGTAAVTPLAAATNGQIPIGSTGADPVLATIGGTANQIVVTNGAGTSTIGTPLLAGNEPVRQVIHGGVATIHAGNNGWGQGRPPNSKITQSAAIAGTRTTAQIFTRTTGTWTADVLIAQYAFFYAAAAPSVGNWLPIVDNDGTTLTVTGTILAAANTVKTCIWNPIQRTYAHGQGVGAFADGFFDGQNGWLVPFSFANLVKVNPADGTMTSYAHGQEAGAFMGSFFDGQNGWLVPSNSANLVKVNPADGTMTSYAHGQGAGAFTGGFFDGQNGWLVPSGSANLVAFSPIGFGIKSTPTAGGVTSLLTLDDGANWRITMNFVGGILTAKTTAASSGQCATWS